MAAPTYKPPTGGTGVSKGGDKGKGKPSGKPPRRVGVTHPFGKGSSYSDSGKIWKHNFVDRTGTKPLTKGSTPHQPKGSTTTTTQGTTPPPPNPFLTPAQQLAWSDWQTAFGTKMNALGARLTAAPGQTAQQKSIVQHNAAVQTDIQNQVMAARGMFMSSVHDAALNDISAHTTMISNNLDTNLYTLQQTLQGQLDQGLNDFGHRSDYYNKLMVENAQAITPTPNTPVTTTTTANTPKTTGGSKSKGGGAPAGHRGWFGVGNKPGNNNPGNTQITNTNVFGGGTPAPKGRTGWFGMGGGTGNPSGSRTRRGAGGGRSFTSGTGIGMGAG